MQKCFCRRAATNGGSGGADSRPPPARCSAAGFAAVALRALCAAAGRRAGWHPDMLTALHAHRLRIQECGLIVGRSTKRTPRPTLAAQPRGSRKAPPSSAQQSATQDQAPLPFAPLALASLTYSSVLSSDRAHTLPTASADRQLVAPTPSATNQLFSKRHGNLRLCTARH